MNTPPALLSFFRQEAGEYLDRLDELLAKNAASAPDADTFLAHSRALRGAATMTKLPGLPDLAATVEKIGAKMVSHPVAWDSRLHMALKGAITELRDLVAKVDTWTDTEQRQARTQSVALAAVATSYMPSLNISTSPTSPVVPIAKLFPSDGGPGLVERNPSPSITLAQRFRNDMAAAGDGVAREAANLIKGDPGTQQIALTDALRRALLGLSDAADSYGAASIAKLAVRLSRSRLESSEARVRVQQLAQLVMDRELSDAELAAKIREMANRLVSNPSATPAQAITTTPALKPAPVQSETENIIPIESLLYRGPSALARAKEVQAEIRKLWTASPAAGAIPNAAALLDELGDLLELASS